MSAARAHVCWARGSTAWDAAAFALALAGLGVATSWILAYDSDPSSVAWPVVLLPIPLTLLRVLFPSTRWFSIALLGTWCVLTGFTIGWLLLPSFFALVVAAAISRRRGRGMETR